MTSEERYRLMLLKLCSRLWIRGLTYYWPEDVMAFWLEYKGISDSKRGGET